MNTVYFVLVGLAAGWLAGQVKKRGSSLVIDVIVGVAGAFLGGHILDYLDFSTATGLTGELLTAAAGAVILLVVVSFLRGES